MLAILLEAGHLSQTFYLLCTQLGLGPYITAAIDDAELERALELDPLFEAPLAVCGCGRAPAQRSPLDPEFRDLYARRSSGAATTLIEVHQHAKVRRGLPCRAESCALPSSLPQSRRWFS